MLPPNSSLDWALVNINFNMLISAGMALAVMTAPANATGAAATPGVSPPGC